MMKIRKLVTTIMISGALLAAGCADNPAAGTEVQPTTIARFNGGGGFGSGNRIESDTSSIASGQSSTAEITTAGGTTTLAPHGGGFGSGN